jgi:hypothetical protein
MHRLSRGSVILILAAALPPGAWGQASVPFGSDMGKLPSKKGVTIVYKNPSAEKVEAEYSYEPFTEKGVYPTLDVAAKNEQGEWKIKLFPMDPGKKIFLRLRVTAAVSAETKAEINRAVFAMFLETIEAAASVGYLGPAKSVAVGKPFLDRAALLSPYSWKDGDKPVPWDAFLSQELLVHHSAYFDFAMNLPGDLLDLKKEAAGLLVSSEPAKPPAGFQNIWTSALGEKSKTPDEGWAEWKAGVHSLNTSVLGLDISALRKDPEAAEKAVADLKTAFQASFGRYLQKKLEILGANAEAEKQKQPIWPDIHRLDLTGAGIEAIAEEAAAAAKGFRGFKEKIAGTICLRTSAQTGEADIPDLKFYIGVDTTILHSPKAKETQAYMTFAIFCKKQLEDLSLSNENFWDCVASRLTPMIGFSTGLLGDSDLPKQTYYFGFGWRLNKYCRLTLGVLAYASQETETIDGASNTTTKMRYPVAVGLSFDSKAFSLIWK